MGRVSICQKNGNTIDLRRAQVNNLWSEGCLVTTVGCPQGYTPHLVSGVTIGCSYWLFGGHAHLGKFLLNQSNDGRMC